MGSKESRSSSHISIIFLKAADDYRKVTEKRLYCHECEFISFQKLNKLLWNRPKGCIQNLVLPFCTIQTNKNVNHFCLVPRDMAIWVLKLCSFNPNNQLEIFESFWLFCPSLVQDFGVNLWYLSIYNCLVMIQVRKYTRETIMQK